MRALFLREAIMEMTISIIWGRSCNYVPGSMVPFDFSGELFVSDGELNYLDHLHYRFVQWTQAMEIPERIFDRDWAMPSRLRLLWMTDTEPGSAGTLEGLRLSVDGDAETKIKKCCVDYADYRLQCSPSLRDGAAGCAIFRVFTFLCFDS